MPLPGDIRLVASIGRPTEAAIVMAAAFGADIARSTIYAAYLWTRPLGAVVPIPFTDPLMHDLFASELAGFLVLLAFLWVRGWTAQRFGFAIGWKSTLTGLGLAVAVFLACCGLEAGLLWSSAWFRQAASIVQLENRGLTLPTIAVSSVMNGTYEETFLCGYLLNAASTPRARQLAAAGSMLIRLSYHTYQGPLGVLNTLVFGAALTAYALKTRRLWPPILAHICIDIAGLATLPLHP